VNCPVGKMSCRRNVQTIGKLLSKRSVVWAKCPVTRRSCP